MCQEQTDPFSVACNAIALQPALQLRSPRIVARRRTPALRAFAPDSMVGLAFTQHPTPPDPDDPNYTARADFEFDARRAELWTSSARAPRQSASQRSARVNTTRPPSATRAGRLSWTTRRSKASPRRTRSSRGSCTSRLVCMQPRVDRDGLRGWRLATGPEARLLCHEYAGLPRPRRALDLGGHRAAMGLPASAIASSGNAPAHVVACTHGMTMSCFE